MRNVIEELAGMPNIDYQTLSIMSLMNQNLIGATTVSPALDEENYIEVRFKENIDEAFRKLFIRKAKEYNVLKELYKCPFNQCLYHNIPRRKENLQTHLTEHMGDADHPIDISNANSTIKRCFYMKRGKYYGLALIIRHFVFNTIEDIEDIEEAAVRRNRIDIPDSDISFLIEGMTNLPSTNFQTLSLVNLINQNLTNSSNLAMCSDDNEYIEIFFRQNINLEFNQLFVGEAKTHNIFSVWFKCSAPRCTRYYDIMESWDHTRAHDNEGEFFIIERHYWMKKGKYYDLSPIIRCFVFDTYRIED